MGTRFALEGMASNPHRHQVLLIDDDEDTRGGVAELIRMDGCEVVEAADGAEALATLRAGCRPCVMLLDLNMPGMSGWEFREQQRRDRRIAQVPVVVLSGHCDLEQQALLGFEAFVFAASNLVAAKDPQDPPGRSRGLGRPRYWSTRVPPPG